MRSTGPCRLTHPCLSPTESIWRLMKQIRPWTVEQHSSPRIPAIGLLTSLFIFNRLLLKRKPDATEGEAWRTPNVLEAYCYHQNLKKAHCYHKMVHFPWYVYVLLWIKYGFMRFSDNFIVGFFYILHIIPTRGSSMGRQDCLTEVLWKVSGYSHIECTLFINDFWASKHLLRERCQFPIDFSCIFFRVLTEYYLTI